MFEAGPFSAAFSISGEKFTSELESKRMKFDQQFEKTFSLESKVNEHGCRGFFYAPTTS